MTTIKKQSRKGRTPSRDNAKKGVSLTLDPALIIKIDEYATQHNVSRSQAIENAIAAFFTKPVNGTQDIDEVLSNEHNYQFAAPNMDNAILY